jgi:hypothetical protein
VKVKGEATAAYSIAGREQALDFMAAYPGYGEQRWYSDALATEQVSVASPARAAGEATATGAQDKRRCAS